MVSSSWHVGEVKEPAWYDRNFFWGVGGAEAERRPGHQSAIPATLREPGSTRNELAFRFFAALKHFLQILRDGSFFLAIRPGVSRSMYSSIPE